MGSTFIQEDDCPKEEFQDEPIKHILQNVPEMISSFFCIFGSVKELKESQSSSVRSSVRS